DAKSCRCRDLGFHLFRLRLLRFLWLLDLDRGRSGGRRRLLEQRIEGNERPELEREARLDGDQGIARRGRSSRQRTHLRHALHLEPVVQRVTDTQGGPQWRLARRGSAIANEQIP